MELERVRPTVLRITLHTYELAALTAAARYVAETAPAEVPPEAVSQLRDLLAGYDSAVRGLGTAPPDHTGAPPDHTGPPAG
ncbi:hypothetical protein ABZ714_20615 [Streptomyces sp. NPDC006798]|uniref:hypothetical protein n=1 Tax=Streptomyces sp. NPDC006798 TaxID=3155462 RepID=UPI003407DBD0